MSRQQGERRIFVSDCEGPISKNDNAFEVSQRFLPRGDSFFSLVSKYDDVLADVVKKPGYRAGDTLKLIAPFLKAFGVTNKEIREYSSRNILLVRGATDMLHYVRDAMPAFIVSASYEQYMYALCSATGFPYRNVYCTKLDLDKCNISESEAERLKRVEEEISGFPMIEIPQGATSLSQFSERDRETVKRLDSIFWEEIPRMPVGSMLQEVRPVGGQEKANALKDITEHLDVSVGSVMYVGDSITDVQILQMVKDSGGLAVSFNGNGYAVRNADVAVLAENAVITSVLANVFFRSGREGVMKLVAEWNYSGLEKYCKDGILILSVVDAYPKALPKVKSVSAENVDRLVEESSSFRKTVRGEAIGKLG